MNTSVARLYAVLSTDILDDSTARNAAESPFLRLTPEIRCRIYDFLYGSTPAHIRSAEGWEYDEDFRHFRLASCECPRDHMEIPPRYVEWVNVAARTRIPGCTIRQDPDDEKSLSSADINLGLLLVCRQIHHEAALKPFSEIPFYCIIRTGDRVPGLEGFAEALALPQLRALGRMRFVIENTYYGLNTEIYRTLASGRLPDRKVMQKFPGLNDIETVLAARLWDETEVRRYLANLTESIKSMEWMQVLRELCPKRLRMTIETEFSELGKNEKSKSYPTFASRGETARIDDWLRTRELQLHFGKRIANGDEPMPACRTKQDDDAISIPPWLTPEALREFELARPEEARLTQLEEQEVHTTWNAMIEEREKEDEINPIITPMDFHNFTARQANRSRAGEDETIEISDDDSSSAEA